MESAVDGDDILLLVTPLKLQMWPAMLVLETGFLYNMPGYVTHDEDVLIAHSRLGDTVIRTTGTRAEHDANIRTQSPYFACEFSGEVAFYTGRPRTVAEIRTLLDKNRSALIESFARYGENAAVYEAIQCAIAWDTTYDARRDRIALPISRLWSIDAGGFVLFCWDYYFCSFMRKNGNAVYGCMKSEFPKPEWGRYTQNGNVVYALVMDSPVGPLSLPGFSADRIKSCRLLSDGSELKLLHDWRADNYENMSYVNIPHYSTYDKIYTAVKITLKD